MRSAPKAMSGRLDLRSSQNRTTVFSPFGLGILDLAVGKAVYDEIARGGNLQEIDGFFHEMQRYGTGPERR